VTRIAVVGGYGVGLVFRVPRVPRAGETLVGEEFCIDHGGKGSNQAVGMARLGAQVALLAAVGDDEFGRGAQELWRREGVRATALVAAAPTMAGAILVEPTGENRIVIVPGALAELRPAHVRGFAAEIAAADVCVTGLEIPLETAVEALRVAREHGVATVLNPAPAPDRPLAPELLALADHLTPNITELARLTGPDGLEAAAVEQAARALAERSGGVVTVTRGAAGALVMSHGVAVPVAAARVAVVDTTGAGDAFTAAYAVAIAGGHGPVVAAGFACRAAGHAVRFAGVVPALPRQRDLPDLPPPARAAIPTTSPA